MSTGKYTDIPQLPQLLREGKIHKPTRSAGSEQSPLRVPFLLESQAHPGEKETGKKSEKPGAESTNPPRAIRVGKRTFIYGGLDLVSKGITVLQLHIFVPATSFLFTSQLPGCSKKPANLRLVASTEQSNHLAVCQDVYQTQSCIGRQDSSAGTKEFAAPCSIFTAEEQGCRCSWGRL